MGRTGLLAEQLSAEEDARLTALLALRRELLALDHDPKLVSLALVAALAITATPTDAIIRGATVAYLQNRAFLNRSP